MDATPEAFACRCLPLNIANAHGWQLLSPCGFEAEWNGGSAVDDVVIRLDPGASQARAPVALFGQGVLTFHVEGLFRTPPGYNLWVGGSPNEAKDGIAALGGMIETDWSPFSFTMNWRFTRPDHVIRFEENEPFCFFFPIRRGALLEFAPRIEPIEGEPELRERFEAWSASRDGFQAEVASHPPECPAARWQKTYYRGVDVSGAVGTADHQTRLRLPEFEGADRYHREAPARRPVPGPPGSVEVEAKTLARRKREWRASSLERLRSMASSIPRRAGVSPQIFLEAYYAANRPVVLAGEMAGWPALDRWTPEYLKHVVGSREVEVQANRAADEDFERNMTAHRSHMPFDAFIDRISAPNAGNDVYLTAWNSASNAEALSPLQADLGSLDKLLIGGEVGQGATSQGMMWIGPAGTFTPLHHDLTNNLLLQIRGRKMVLLVEPADTDRLYNDHHVYSRIRDLTEPGLVDRFPKLEGLRVHQVLLTPGEALFIPLGWWHQVRALDFSVSITRTDFRWPNDFHETWPGS
jgi:hypothetical protein